MRRPAVALFAFAAAAAVVSFAPAEAQEEGCDADSPCPWLLDLDESGFLPIDGQEPSFTPTVGDYYRLDVQNLDSAPHRLTLAGSEPALDFTVEGSGSASGGAAESSPFRFTAAGSYTLVDQASGDEVVITATAEDSTVVGELGEPTPTTVSPTSTPSASPPAGGGGRSGGDEGADNGAPALPVAFVVVAALAVAANRRR